MDTEIRRLLKLDTNPFYRLSEAEKKKLKEWKKAQKRVVPKRRTVPKGFVEDKEMGTKNKPSLIPKKEIGEKNNTLPRPKKTTNQVKKSEKELGTLEES